MLIKKEKDNVRQVGLSIKCKSCEGTAPSPYRTRKLS